MNETMKREQFEARIAQTAAKDEKRARQLQQERDELLAELARGPVTFAKLGIVAYDDALWTPTGRKIGGPLAGVSATYERLPNRQRSAATQLLIGAPSVERARVAVITLDGGLHTQVTEWNLPKIIAQVRRLNRLSYFSAVASGNHAMAEVMLQQARSGRRLV